VATIATQNAITVYALLRGPSLFNVSNRSASFPVFCGGRPGRRAGAAANIPFRVHVHMLCHARGYALANKGMSLALEFEFGILLPFCSSFLWTPNFEIPTKYFVGIFFLEQARPSPSRGHAVAKQILRPL
jgi:hypothetical protein